MALSELRLAVWAKRWASVGAGRPPHHEPASGQRAPPLIIRPGSQGPWARVRGTGSPPCTPEDREFSRGPYFQQVSHPRRGRVPREDLETWGLGGARATVPRPVDMDSAGGTHAHGWVLPWGLRPAPAWVAKSPPSAQTAPPCPEAAN